MDSEHLFRFALGLTIALALGLAPAPLVAQSLDDDCTVTALNRYVQVDPNGSFALGNVPVPLGAFRVRVVCERDDGAVDTGNSAFLIGVPDGETEVGEIFFGAGGTPIPASLGLSSPATVLTPAANGAQLVTTGTRINDPPIDLTAASTGTIYLSTNTAVATVTADGFVTAVGSGNFLITASNEGLIATLAMRAELTDDRDGDGLPDDFEDAAGVDPGGALLTGRPGVEAIASSSLSTRQPARVIDGRLMTSWISGYRDAASFGATPFVEVILPEAADVAQIRIFGNREPGGRYRSFAGVVQVFDAAGVELLDTGELQLPLPNNDLLLPVDLAGVARVRYTSTADAGPYVSLAEIQLFTAPGSAASGLDADNPADADLDFDLDGLSNLEEFALGTDVFAADTDGDGLLDGQELAVGSSPLLADTDGDGLLDGQEVDPTSDVDGDGMINILDQDSDGDGLLDGLEGRLGLDPLRADTDFDAIPDGGEDTDGDRFPNAEEQLAGTDPGNPDSDGDGAVDGVEVLSGCDPLSAERTVLSGRVVDGGGAAVAGATVRAIGLGVSVQTGGDGSFAFADLTACPRTIQVLAEARPAGAVLRALSPPLDAVLGATTDAGDLRLEPFTGPRFPSLRYATGDEPVAVALSDLDNDGRADVLVLDGATGELAIRVAERGLLGAATSVPTGAAPEALVVVDLDADGLPDAVTANPGTNDVSVLLGDGLGGFLPASSWPVGDQPAAITAADFDRDGRLDLATGNSGSGDVSVLLGNGDGTFRPERRSAAALSINALAAGDVDGDGILDLVPAGGHRPRALIGSGDGLFPIQAPLFDLGGVTSAVLTDVALTDVNGDGNLDAALTGDDAVLIHFGRGDGSFLSAVTVPVGAAASSLALADLDRDGRLDLAVASRGSREVSLLYGSDDLGFFETPRTIATGTAAVALAAGDLDGDGTLDLITVAGDAEDALTVTLSTDRRQYHAARRIPAAPRPMAVVATRLNADRQLDLVVGNDTASTVKTLTGNPDGSFGEQDFFHGGSRPTSVVVLDGDGDGRLDAAFASRATHNVSLMTGNGDGTFFFVPDRYNVGNDPRAIASGDFNRDGIDDVVTADFGSDALSVLLGQPDGSFAPPLTLAAGSGPLAVAVGDFDGDGNEDVAAANEGSDDLSVFLGNGDGTLGPELRIGGFGAGPRALLAIDLDDDGLDDLVTANGGSNDLAILTSTGSGFAAARRLATVAGPSAVVAGDVDGDGVLDLAASSEDAGEIALFLGTGGDFAPPLRIAAGRGPSALTLADLDDDGILDLVASNRLSEDLSLIVQQRLSPAPLVDAGAVAPTVAILEPADGATRLAEDTLRIEVAADDDVAVRAVTISVDGVAVRTDTTPPYQLAVRPPLPEGVLTIEATAVDFGGNVGSAPPVTVAVVADSPPTVSLTAPPAGTELIAGETAILRAEASDNGTVTAVVFAVDGVDQPAQTAPPFELEITVPPTGSSLAVAVTATDDRGQTGSDARVFEIVPDPLTTVIGMVVDTSGQPIAGASATVLGRAAATAADGTFAIPNVPTIEGDLRVAASADLDGTPVSGLSASVAPVAGGNTDVGVIVLIDKFVFVDPAGDGFGVTSDDRDVVTVTVDPEGTDVLITVETVSNVSPSRLDGFLSFDLDQDPATGTASVIDTFNPGGFTFLGVELEIQLVAGVATDGTPVAVIDNTFTLTLPLSRLGGDLDLNFAVVLLDSFSTDSGDAAPDRSFYSIPSDLDSDGDGLLDSLEPLLGLDRFASDSDGDGVADGDEDFDGDGLGNLDELLLGTDPALFDSDGDGLGDGDEALVLSTDPRVVDTDGGGRGDGAEVLFDGTDPLDPADDRQPLILSNSSFAQEPRLAVDAGGNLHVVWTGLDPINFCLLPIYSMISAGGETLIDDTPLSSVCDDARSLSVTVDAAGWVHVVWLEGQFGFDNAGFDNPGGGDKAGFDVAGTVRTKTGIGGTELIYAKIDPAADDRDGSAADPVTIQVVAPRVIAQGGQDSPGGKIFVAEPRVSTDARGHAHLLWTVFDFGGIGPEELRYLIAKNLPPPSLGLHYLQLDAAGEPALPERALFENYRGTTAGGTSALAVASGGDVHIVLTGENPDRVEGLYYAMLDGVGGDLLIDATELTAGSTHDGYGFPSAGVTVGGEVAVVYQAAVSPAAEVLTLRIDPARDDQDGDAAVLADVLVIDPRLLTATAGIASSRPNASFDRDGNISFAYYELSPETSTFDVFARGSDPIGITRVPRQRVTRDGNSQIGQETVAGVAVSGPSIHVAWTLLDQGSLGVALFTVNPDQDRDGLANVEELALGTDPADPDTDGGGRGDGEEVLVDGTDPLDPSDDLP